MQGVNIFLKSTRRSLRLIVKLQQRIPVTQFHLLKGKRESEQGIRDPGPTYKRVLHSSKTCSSGIHKVDEREAGQGKPGDGILETT